MGMFDGKKTKDAKAKPAKRPNKGMASCDFPGCGFEDEQPGVVIQHKARKHRL